ncbi:endolytic transglycosylase MltG [Streptomyces laculatispora]|uniref:Endolytic murein transglycosylase n=1 Tax=Streptomyces laculatispora TaxID=887464 RepID=A0ABY9IC84_9ACTN|nr:endolytic transglycosylase MltG [Streptomyces laculatispora]WLQ44224.1 endolytic transglycosylase MltG [Streptomyces laculatispora]
MTEYGRGPGSEPWHPEDPLYGDQGWGGQQPAHGQSQYGGQQQPYPQDPYAAQQPQDPYAAQQQPQDPYAQQHRPQDPYAQQQQHQPQDPYAQQHQDPYAQQQHQQQQDPYAQQQQQPYGAQEDPYGQQPPYNGGWDTGQQAASMPYEGQPAATYGYGETHDYYGTPEAYPPPQPPGRRQAAPEQAPEQEPAQAPEQEPAQNPDWDPEVQPEETHPFFTGVDNGDAKDDDYDDDPRESRRGGGDERRGKGKKKKGRSGCACLVVSLVLVGGLGGAGYLGYSYYQDKFGPAEDYAGSGSGSVEIEIPKGSYGYDIGNILKKQGVVKSVDAFVSAQNENPKGKSIQAGVYLLHEKMSAAEALKMMIDPKSQNLLIIPEGTPNRTVYAAIDRKLGVKKGTTGEVAKKESGNLGLPDWADGHRDILDPLEGFLYPAAYPVTKGMKPEVVLKKMVSRANEEYDKADLEANAKRLKLQSPWQLITVASLVQAEGKYKHDFDKVSRVVYNRLKPNNTETNGLLDFDSTVNYAKKQSTLDTGAVSSLREFKHPYNTYYIHGLPPGPINNPGDAALQSAIKPTPGPWYYFVSVTEDKTLFAVTNAEHERNRAKYQKGGAGE